MKLVRDLFERQLQHLYTSEELILKALPEMLDYARDEGLCDIIKTQIRVTYEQKNRLKEIGKYLKFKIKVNDGKIIRGLLEEIHELYSEIPKGLLLDVAIISKILHIQHFQISAYETCMLYVKRLDLVEIEVILDKTLNEAYEADEECSGYAKYLLSIDSDKP